MRATNAKIDLPAFGVRSIEVPSFPGDRDSVNQVLRFQLSAPLRFRTKKARETSNVSRASSPGLHRVVAARPGPSVRYGPDGFKAVRHLTLPRSACKVSGEMTTSALSRIPASLIELSGACAVILFVVISILPR
jgi:hypothetical protein